MQPRYPVRGSLQDWQNVQAMLASYLAHFSHADSQRLRLALGERLGPLGISSHSKMSPTHRIPCRSGLARDKLPPQQLIGQSHRSYRFCSVRTDKARFIFLVPGQYFFRQPTTLFLPAEGALLMQQGHSLRVIGLLTIAQLGPLAAAAVGAPGILRRDALRSHAGKMPALPVCERDARVPKVLVTSLP